MKLIEKKCVACRSNTPTLSTSEAAPLLTQLNDWRMDKDKKEIFREFRFENYYQSIAFVNALAWIAHEEDHHPALEVYYNRCVVHFSTHAVNGLTENDFICAAKIDNLLT